MTLEEAIKHCEEVAEEQEKAAKEWHENQVRKCELIRFAEMDYTRENECKKCAEEHRQLAEWLKELKQLREQELVLDKIRDEIEEIEINGQIRDVECFSAGVNVALKIIDKYRAESEDKE